MAQIVEFNGFTFKINPENRKELLITLDMKKQSEIREILSANNIEYVVKTTNLQSATVVGSQRAYTGNYGINQDYSYEYKIFSDIF